MRLLITGATGVVGGAIARHAERTDHEVHARRGRLAGDLLTPGNCAAVVRSARPQVVIHAAGATYGDPATLWRDNVLMALRILDAVREHAADARVILMGSAAEYGFTPPGERLPETAPCRPNSEYGMSKLAMTRLAGALLHPRVTIARLFNVVTDPYDPRSLLGRVAAGFAAGDENPVGAGEVRDFVHVDQVAVIILALAASADPPPVVNVCTGAPLTAAEYLGRPRPKSLGSWAVGDTALLRRTIGEF